MIYIGDVTIYEYVNIGTNNGKSAINGEYETKNYRVCILGTKNIGTDAVIMAGSVATKDIEPFVIVGGSPAKKIETKE